MNFFSKSTLSFSKNTAIIDEERLETKYSDLDNFSKIFSEHIPSRSLIISLNKNSTASIVGYISFINNEIVPLMIDAKMDIQLINKLIDNYKPSFLWLPTNKINDFPKTVSVFEILDYSLLKFENHEVSNIHKDLALLLTTSGSTGSPKVVKISYENIQSNAFSIIKYLSLDSNEKPITTLPMSYSFGLSIINSHLFVGATILLTDRSIFEKEFWAFLKKEKATSISGVPYTYDILNKLRFTRMELPHLKTLTQAGGKINEILHRDFAEFCKKSKKRFFVMYGQTEATARMSYLPCDQALSKIGSIGIPIPDGKFNLINENSKNIEKTNTVGELIYEGPNVCMGYAESIKDLSENDKNQGKLLTGDLAKMDKDGFYYIVGRKKRFLKIFGNRINLDELEGLLKEITADCACTGNDEKIVVYITDELKTEKIRDYISSKLRLHHSIFSINIIEEIPKSSSGKTIYSELKI
tara:strand:- start:19025 stop:20431 length:1407 start_codon:yes stop_codon:yes gene_type:complete